MDTPPPLPAAPTPKRSNRTLWIVLACVGGLFVLTVPITLAILIPTVAKVRETARRTVDQSNARQIGQGTLIFASVHDMGPPVGLSASGEIDPATPATIHAVAAALARDAGLNDGSVWFSSTRRVAPGPVLTPDRRALDATFARQEVIDLDFVTGLTLTMPTTTPIAWTRGLREDGTWDRSGVNGDAGGHVVFLGGNVTFFRDLKRTPLIRPDGTPTSNILETLPATARVVGSGPGTLHGHTGHAN